MAQMGYERTIAMKGGANEQLFWGCAKVLLTGKLGYWLARPGPHRHNRDLKDSKSLLLLEWSAVNRRHFLFQIRTISR